MCQISNTIRFCSCSPSEARELTNYWILYRKHQLAVMTLGELMLPLKFDPKIHLKNTQIILQVLNGPDAFDFDLNVEKGDCLCVRFEIDQESFVKHFSYCFEFQEKKWIETEEFPFRFENEYKEINSGKVENAKIASSGI